MDLLNHELNLLFEKLFKHYLEPEFYGALDKKSDYITKIKVTEFLDEYLASLIKGHINIRASSELDTYIMEVLEDEWFLQWPSIRWAYASRILNNGKRGKKGAIEILFQLAKEGYPGALYDIGFCYRNGIGVERDYKKAICLFMLSSSMEYCEADERLELEWSSKEAKELGVELRFFFLYYLLLAGTRRYNLKIENDIVIEDENINKEILKIYKKTFSEYKKLQKTVVKKECLRGTFDLLWTDEENPYKIDF